MNLITAVSAVLLVYAFAIWAVIRKRRDVSPLLALAILSYLVFWNAYPFVYGIFLLEWDLSLATRQTYERLVVVHLAILVSTLLLFATLTSRVSTRVRDFLGTVETSPATALKALVIGGMVYLLVVQRTLSLRGGSYAEATSFLMSAGAGEAGRIAILDTVAYFILCLGVAALVTVWQKHGRLIAVLGWGVIAAYVLSGLLQAMRAVVLLPATLMVAINLQRARLGMRTHWRLVVLVFAGTVAVAPLVAAAVGLVRILGTGRLDLAAVQQGFDVVVSNLSPLERARLGAQEVNTKFDAFTYGAILLDTDGVGTAGWKPYTSSLLSPIPRIFLRDKPVPTSKNGQNAGMPYRVAAESFGRVELGMVVPVTPVAIVLWELGYSGLVLIVIMNLFSFLVANSLLVGGSLFGRAVGVAMLSLPTTEFLFAPPASLMRDLPRYGMILLMIWVAVQALASYRRYARRPITVHGEASA